jgi:hypothetical protein
VGPVAVFTNHDTYCTCCTCLLGHKHRKAARCMLGQLQLHFTPAWAIHVAPLHGCAQLFLKLPVMAGMRSA